MSAPSKPPPGQPPQSQPSHQNQPSQSRGLAIHQTPGLRTPSNKKTIYDRNLNRTKNAELSRAAFAYLFVEMIGYAQRRVSGVADLEIRLNAAGYPIGLRLLDLLLSRTPTSSTQPPTARPTRILPLLQFLSNTLWKHLFARPADALERSAQNPAEYMITDNAPLVSEYISVPSEIGSFNPGALVAGIMEGVCDGAGFGTVGGKGVGVSAHWSEDTGGGLWPGRTIFLIRFSEEVLEREEILGRGS